MQVGDEIDERELIAAFWNFGRVVGHRLLRNLECGPVEMVEEAASARQGLHMTACSGFEVCVEFKVISEMLRI